MTEYRIVYARATFSLAAAVQKLLNEGWKISGSLVVNGDPIYEGFYQAMTKTQPAIPQGEW